MKVVKQRLFGSDFIGAYAVASERFVFCFRGIEGRKMEMLAETLIVKPVGLTIADSDLIGIFSRANSNGILLSNLATEDELAALRALGLDINIGVLDSRLCAVGCNVLANDKIAFINSDYSAGEAKVIEDTLGVETVRAQTGGYKTVGANNILTDSGLVINNRSTDEEKRYVEGASGFRAVRSTANTGALAIGLAGAANSKGIVIGDATTGYELNRILEYLETG